MPLRGRFASLILLPFALLAAACHRSARPEPIRPRPPGDTLTFDATREIACHNCYDPDRYSRRLKHAVRQVRSIELDFWPRRAGAWQVRHDSIKGRNNCGESGTRGLDLAGCFHVLAKVLESESAGDGPPPALTVFLDQKARLDSPREMESLDSLAAAVFGQRLFRPSDLPRGPQQRGARGAGNPKWPVHGALRGRVMLVLTGGDAGGKLILGPKITNPQLERYVRARQGRAAMFVAPSLVNPGDVKDVPFFDSSLEKWVAFGNMQSGPGVLELNESVRAHRWIGRVWSGDQRVCRHLDGRVARIALYHFERKVPCKDVQPDNWPPAPSALGVQR